MDDKKPSSRPVPADGAAPAVPHRRRWLGSAVAVVTLVAIAGLAWYLTHRAGPTAGGDGQPAVAGAPRGSGWCRRRAWRAPEHRRRGDGAAAPTFR